MPTDASWWLSSAQKTSSEALFAEAGSVGAERACSKAEAGIVLNVPTVLTLMRVAAVPALAWAYFQGGVAAAAAFWCFAGAAITDFMDGYLARSLGQATRFGAFLDPVADKLIVVTTMVLLAAAPPGPLEGVGVPAWALPAAALVIACRELLVSAVRVEGGWSGSGCSIVAGAGGLVGAPRQGSPNGSLHTRASAHLLSQGGTFGTSWASG
jgi:phosphatidylglycerophosphate synthase